MCLSVSCLCHVCLCLCLSAWVCLSPCLSLSVSVDWVNREGVSVVYNTNKKASDRANVEGIKLKFILQKPDDTVDYKFFVATSAVVTSNFRFEYESL